ncbi:MAG TPA: PAS domain S-box protein [Acidobacteriota bacterium]|nr:PAS domain S-box protein [Acidobacteriota bacterium]
MNRIRSENLGSLGRPELVLEGKRWGGLRDGSLLSAGVYLAGFILLDLLGRGVELYGGAGVWAPAEGLSLAVLLTFGLRWTPLVAMTYLASALTTTPGLSNLPQSLLWTAGTTLILASAVWLARRWMGLDARLRQTRDIILFLSLSGTVSLLLAGLHLGLLSTTPLPAQPLNLETFLLCWGADLLGIMLVTPFLVLLFFPGVRRLAGRRLSISGLRSIPRPALVQGTALAAVTSLILWAVLFWPSPAHTSLGYLLFLPLIWGALRFGLEGASTLLPAFGAAALFSASDYGLRGPHLDEALALMLTLGLTGLVLGAVVSQRHRVLQQLSVEKAYLEQLFQSAPEAIVIVDNQSRILRANNEFTRLFGYQQEEFLGRRVDHLIVPEDFREEALTVTGKIMNEESVSLETLRRRKDGELINVSILGTPITVDGGQVAVYGIYRDITERRELEDQLRQSQKMEAVGRLAGGIAHDFNNLLTAVLGYSDLLREHKPDQGRFGHYVEEIRKAANRAQSLTSQLLAFSRKQVLLPKKIRLGEIVSNIEPLLRRLLGEQITIQLSLSPDRDRIKADPGQIEQVIVNLAVNARDAIEGNGKIRLEVRPAQLDEAYSRNHSVLPGEYVLLQFEDDGCGMTPEVRRRVFEPFFTTKEQGKGTGLGLATVYGIVKQSGGHIDLDSRSGRGSSFRIYFPRVADKPVHEPATRPKESATASQSTILLVEDEGGLRELISEVLREHGFRVLEARNGSQALLMAEAYGGVIDLLLTDVVMPEMSGRELSQRLEGQRSGFLTLFMSGYTGREIMRENNLPTQDFIQKPFAPSELVQKVQSFLSANGRLTPAAKGQPADQALSGA